MSSYLVTIKTVAAERDVYVSAKSEAAAVAQVRKTLAGFEARWASVFVG